ncbi:MAG: hypothetical protein ACXW3U_14865 [Rhodoplanes sp.]
MVAYLQPRQWNPRGSLSLRSSISIYIQRVRSDGIKEGPPKQVFYSDDFAPFHPEPELSLVYNSYWGHFVLVWDWKSRNGKGRIYTLQISIFGNVEGDATTILETSDDVRHPIAIYNPSIYDTLPNHRVLLVWEQQAGNRSNIYALDTGPDGDRRLSKPLRLSAAREWEANWNPAAAVNPAHNEMLVVWNNALQGVYDAGTAKSSVVRGDIKVSSSPLDVLDDPAEEALVFNTTTRRYLLLATTAAGTMIGQHLDVAGERSGRTFGVAWGSPPSDLVINPTQQRFLTLFTRLYAKGNRDIRGVLFSEDGANKHEFGILDSRFSKNDEYSPKGAYNPDRDQYLVVWNHVKTPREIDVHGRIIDSAGRLK